MKNELVTAKCGHEVSASLSADGQFLHVPDCCESCDNELDLGTSLDQVTKWIKDQESVPWCKICGDRPAVMPYEELLCDQCNSQIWRLFLTDDEADS